MSIYFRDVGTDNDFVFRNLGSLRVLITYRHHHNILWNLYLMFELRSKNRASYILQCSDSLKAGDDKLCDVAICEG